MNEQWKDGGRCEECRRKPYCKTECRAHREREKRELFERVAKALGLDRIRKDAKERSDAG